MLLIPIELPAHLLSLDHWPFLFLIQLPWIKVNRYHPGINLMVREFPGLLMSINVTGKEIKCSCQTRTQIETFLMLAGYLDNYRSRSTTDQMESISFLKVWFLWFIKKTLTFLGFWYFSNFTRRTLRRFDIFYNTSFWTSNWLFFTFTVWQRMKWKMSKTLPDFTCQIAGSISGILMLLSFYKCEWSSTEVGLDSCILF